MTVGELWEDFLALQLWQAFLVLMLCAFAWGFGSGLYNAVSRDVKRRRA